MEKYLDRFGWITLYFAVPYFVVHLIIGLTK
jgi:hypothetical protein